MEVSSTIKNTSYNFRLALKSKKIIRKLFISMELIATKAQVSYNCLTVIPSESKKLTQS